MGSETDEIIKDLFEYQKGLEGSMRGSDFVYDSIDALYYDLNKVSLSRMDQIKIPQMAKIQKGNSKSKK